MAQNTSVPGIDMESAIETLRAEHQAARNLADDLRQKADQADREAWEASRTATSIGSLLRALLDERDRRAEA